MPAVFLYVLVGPLLEEVVFRRVLLDYLLGVLPRWVAVPIVSACFALVHIAPPLIVYNFFLGIALAMARLWFRSLWGPFLLHVSNNALVTCGVLLAL
ncbi:CPBP family intramembrane glutamic endopeptidase [Corynebacterium heidelbergense]|uniref:CPBP family intramembrane glutamic endopeptidase n=1 Tax=Corynebacterium heidelbergense TaxID=2055947 RepID=UPI0034E05088